MEEAGHADRVLLADESPIRGDAAFRPALAVLDRKLELVPAGDTAFFVVVIDRKLGPAADQLTGSRITGRRERNDQSDGDRLVVGVERPAHETERSDKHSGARN